MSRKIGTNFPTFNSFIVALCVYLLALGFLFYKLSSFEEAKKYTNTPDAFMDVFVVTDERADDIVAPKKADKKKEAKIDEKKSEEEEIKTTNKMVPQPEATPEPKLDLKQEMQKTEPKPDEDIIPDDKIEPKPEKKPEPKPEKVDLNDLFKSANIKSTPKEKLTQSNKKSDKNNKSSKSASDLFESLQKDAKAKAPLAGNTGEFNEFYGEIQAIIGRVWQSYKADTNNVANVDIFIDKSGKFSYNIKSLSYDKEFNEKVREVLNRLSEMQFPNSPSGKTETLRNFKFRDEIGAQ